ncbi:MAG: divalent cation tolerance protein CutA [Patescibacteria group bacterium]
MVLIYTTCKDTKDAVRLGNEIMNRHLASAVNLWPIQMIMRVGTEVKNELGAGMLIKTMEPKIAEIEELIESQVGIMPYIGAIDIRRFNRAYREWMATVIKE